MRRRRGPLRLHLREVARGRGGRCSRPREVPALYSASGVRDGDSRRQCHDEDLWCGADEKKKSKWARKKTLGYACYNILIAFTARPVTVTVTRIHYLLLHFSEFSTDLLRVRQIFLDAVSQ